MGVGLADLIPGKAPHLVLDLDGDAGIDLRAWWAAVDSLIDRGSRRVLVGADRRGRSGRGLPPCTMPQRPAILVFHGVTMSGASMRRHMGPVGVALEDAGFELVYLDAPSVMSAAQVEANLAWVANAYAAKHQNARDYFCEGMFWDGPKRDWFDAHTEPDAGRKIYRGLEASLAVVRDAALPRRVVGVLGFSQGCAMAGLAAGLAVHGHLPFGGTLEFGVFLGGFKPAFDAPHVQAWPVGGVRGLFAVGTEDPIFPSAAPIEGLAAEFEEPELHRIEGLGHVVPTDAAWVQQIVAFVTQSPRRSGSA